MGKKIEIKSRRRNWIVVELIRFLPAKRMLIRMKGGQLVIRKVKGSRTKVTKKVEVSKRISSFIEPKQKKRKKKKNKVKRKKKRVNNNSAFALAEYRREIKEWQRKNNRRMKKNVSDRRAN